MTAADVARSIVTDSEYEASLLARARAGTLDADLELVIWELAADRRMPMSSTPAPQNPNTLVLIRPVTQEHRP